LNFLWKYQNINLPSYPRLKLIGIAVRQTRQLAESTRAHAYVNVNLKPRKLNPSFFPAKTVP